MLKCCDSEEILKFVDVERRIWLMRNEIIHGGPFAHLAAVVKSTKEAIIAYQTVHVKGRLACAIG